MKALGIISCTAATLKRRAMQGRSRGRWHPCKQQVPSVDAVEGDVGRRPENAAGREGRRRGNAVHGCGKTL
eukprot:5279155-Pleurochrysis_carterae.AAC.5